MFFLFSKVVYNFLWKKKDRIKRNTLIGKVNQGGIGIVDIESKFSAAKASWIRRILDKRTIIKSDHLVDLLQYHSLLEELTKAIK